MGYDITEAFKHYICPDLLIDLLKFYTICLTFVITTPKLTAVAAANRFEDTGEQRSFIFVSDRLKRLIKV